MKSQKGFTLVEILVVVSILLISVGIAGDLIISVVRSYNKTRILNEIEQNANFIIAKISYDLKNARYLVSPTTPSAATFISVIDQNGNTIEYSIENRSYSGTSIGVITRKFASGQEEIMTNDDLTDGVNVNIGSSSFTRIAESPLTIKIALRFDQAPNSLQGKSSEATTPFDKTIILSGASL